ncbi:MAG: methyltransferase domain-containing protein [Cyanothece sp. SIO1E1]|nr:methyltransferase domain-containing protein [Cyanothece sp. SIO1E1]
MKVLVKQQLHSLTKTINSVRYSRFCPVCENPLDAFQPFGLIPRNEAKCLHCGALERHRLVWLYLSRTGFFQTQPKKFLHVAPEIIFKSKFQQRFTSGYLTADLYAENVDLKMDITKIPFPNESFDVIYCSHVLEHVLDDRKAMSEFNRVLSVGGTAYIMVPITGDKTFEDPTVTSPEERERLFGQSDHVRLYGPDFLSRLSEQSWQVEMVSPEDFLSNKEIIRMGITQEAGQIFVCRKKAAFSS